MMNRIIIITAVVVLLILLFLLLFYITKRVNLLMKEVFVDKLKEFDFLIDDKEKKLSELNNEITSKSDKIENLEKEINKLNEFNVKSESSDVVMPKITDLEDGNLLEDYKKIKNNFNFNAEDIIKKLISSNKNNSLEEFKEMKKIKEKFTFDVIYEISTYQSNEQLTIVKELLNENEIKLINGLLDDKKFDVKKFLTKLDKKITLYDPIIKVYVGNKSVNYDYIDSNVKTIFSEEITEGFKLEYKGVIYDYSI